MAYRGSVKGVVLIDPATDLPYNGSYEGVVIVDDDGNPFAVTPLSDALVTPTGGSVGRTLADRAADWLNVKDFGAIGDGVHDDTSAVQACVNAGTLIDFPPGTYKITSTIFFTESAQYFTVRGAGGKASVIAFVDGVAGGSSCFQFSTAVFQGGFIDVLDIFFTSPAGVGAGGVSNLAINVNNQGGLTLRGVSFATGWYSGVALAAAYSMTIEDCIAFNLLGPAINADFNTDQSANNIRIVVSQFYNCGGTSLTGAIQLGSTGAETDNIYIAGNSIESCYRGIDFAFCRGVTLLANYIELCTSAPFKFNGTNYAVSMRGNRIAGNAAWQVENIVGGEIAYNNINDQAITYADTFLNRDVHDNNLTGTASMPTVGTGRVSLFQHPGYIAGRPYSTWFGALNTSQLVAATNTVYFYPFPIFHPITIKTLRINVPVGGSGSAVKMAVYANSIVSNRPLGAPLIVDNTGQATTGTGVITADTSDTLLHPGWYWAASKFTGTLTQTTCLGANQNIAAFFMGIGDPTGTSSGLSVSDTYSNNMPTIAEGASFTVITALGIPHIEIGL